MNIEEAIATVLKRFKMPFYPWKEGSRFEWRPSEDDMDVARALLGRDIQDSDVQFWTTNDYGEYRFTDSAVEHILERMADVLRSRADH